HPPDVVGRDEVPRRAQHVGPQDLALAEGSLDRGVRRAPHPERQRPLGARKVLRLNAAEPADHVRRPREPRARQTLTVEARARDIGHRGRTAYYDAAANTAQASARAAERRRIPSATRIIPAAAA